MEAREASAELTQAGLASSASIAWSRRGSSAVTSGAKRPTTRPSRLIRNFSKFQSTSGPGLGSMP
jgi:hypothetical protein